MGLTVFLRHHILTQSTLISFFKGLIIQRLAKDSSTRSGVLGLAVSTKTFC